MFNELITAKNMDEYVEHAQLIIADEYIKKGNYDDAISLLEKTK